jgi:WD40 repeat protein
MRAKSFQRVIAAVGLAGILVSVGSAHGAGKPTKPPAVPIDPAIVYLTAGNIAVANADGTNQKVVFSDAGIYASPSWSPDGTQIVFASDGTNLSGRGIYRLSINRATAQGVGTPQKIAPLNSTIHANPVWSPVEIQVSAGLSRHFVAYSDATSLNGDDYSIHLVDPASPGSQFKLHSPVINTSEVGDFRLSWSPDATKLVVSRGRDNSQVPPYDIQIVTLQANDCPAGALVCEVQPRQSLVRDIAGSPLMTADTLLNPAWGNTGDQIAVSALISPNGNSDIWAIPGLNPINASNLTNTNKVTPPDRHETLPTWSPNDLQIAYRGLGGICNSKDKNVFGIMVRNVDGSSIDGCKEKILIKDGNFPSWWRNHGVPQP